MSRRVFALLGCDGCAAVQSPSAGTTASHRARSVISRGVTLPNGLRVVLVQRSARERGPGHDALSRRRGRRSRGAGHRAPRRAPDVPAGARRPDAVRALEDIATYFNAFTTYDATTYIARARTRATSTSCSSIEAVRLGLRCTSITDSVFDARARGRHQRARQRRDDAEQLRSARPRAAYPEGHPYRGSIGGTRRDRRCDHARTGLRVRRRTLRAEQCGARRLGQPVERTRSRPSLGKFIARVAKRVAASPAGDPRGRSGCPPASFLRPSTRRAAGGVAAPPIPRPVISSPCERSFPSRAAPSTSK